MIRLARVLLVFARDFTRRATRAGRLTLRRTVFSTIGMGPKYTNLHQIAPTDLVPRLLYAFWRGLRYGYFTDNTPPYDPQMGTYQLRGMLCRVEKVGS